MYPLASSNDRASALSVSMSDFRITDIWIGWKWKYNPRSCSFLWEERHVSLRRICWRMEGFWQAALIISVGTSSRKQNTETHLANESLLSPCSVSWKQKCYEEPFLPLESEIPLSYGGALLGCPLRLGHWPWLLWMDGWASETWSSIFARFLGREKSSWSSRSFRQALLIVFRH